MPQIQPDAVDFDQYYDKILRTYGKYSSSSGSKEYDNSFDTRSGIKDVASIVRRKAMRTSFAGKQDAINILVEVSSQVLEEGGSTLDSEIRKMFNFECIGDTVRRIFDTMVPEELESLYDDTDLGGNLRWVEEHAKVYGADAKLARTIEKFYEVISGDGE